MEHRRENIRRVPEVLLWVGEVVGKIGEVSERELVPVDSVRCGKERDDTWMTIALRTQKMCNPGFEPRVFRVMKCDHAALLCSCCILWVYYSYSAGCLEVFLKATENGS